MSTLFACDRCGQQVNSEEPKGWASLRIREFDKDPELFVLYMGERYDKRYLLCSCCIDVFYSGFPGALVPIRNCGVHGQCCPNRGAA